DATKPLYIDPVLSFSTYLGGSGDDLGYGIAVDSAGNTLIAGQTTSYNFPTVNPFQSTLQGQSNAFVTKINSSGTYLVYSTYLGGHHFDGANGIAVDAAGNAYVVGTTNSSNFPTSPGALRTTNPHPGQYCAFVTKLNATGSGLLYSTYLTGQTSQANGNAITV